MTASKAAGVSYDTAMKAAGDTYTTSVITATEEYDEDYCRITGLYQDAINIINGGGTILPGHFDGAGSMDVEVCFVAGTPILMADGTTKPIEEMEVGDQVLARPHDNPAGNLLKCKVVRTFCNAPQSTYELKFENGLEIRATREHPFYVPGSGWVQTFDLEVGAECVSAEGEPMKLLGKRFIEKQVPVYNFEVENAHTYHVGTSKQTSVLVHNACPDCGDVLNHFFTMCKAKPAGSGPLYDAVSDHGAISGSMHAELAKETANMEVPRLPDAELAGEMSVAFARMLPVSGQIFDIQDILSNEKTKLEKVEAGANLAMSFLGLLGLFDDANDARKAARNADQKAINQADAVADIKSTQKIKQSNVAGNTQTVTKATKETARQANPNTIIRNKALAGKKHPDTGIPFDKDGFPDFSSCVEKEVKITYTGTRYGDEAAANRAAGYKKIPEGMTWHHHQDGVTMQLVPTDIHTKTGHTGSFSLYK